MAEEAGRALPSSGQVRNYTRLTPNGAGSNCFLLVCIFYVFKLIHFNRTSFEVVN